MDREQMPSGADRLLWGTPGRAWGSLRALDALPDDVLGNGGRRDPVADRVRVLRAVRRQHERHARRRLIVRRG